MTELVRMKKRSKYIAVYL